MAAPDLQQALEDAFAEARRRYQERGFQRRVGFGKKPAMINVDEQIIPSVRRLLDAFRRNKQLVVFATTCYQNTDRNDPHTDMGLWHHKIPVEAVPQNQPELWAIDDRIAPIDGEPIVIKKHASAFHGTFMAGFLRAAGVDTILVTGVTACACVRQTVCDGLAEGFRPIAVKECIGDRVPGAVEWNLFDIDAKFGDVESLEQCIEYLDRL